MLVLSQFLVAAFLFAMALLCIVLIYGRGLWWVKAILIVGALLASVGLHRGIEEIKGWPSDRALPERFTVVAVHIVEPSAKRRDPGAIYVWYVADNLWLEADKPSIPRATRIPYTRPDHKTFGAAGERASEGNPVVMKAIEKKPLGDAGRPDAEDTIHYEFEFMPPRTAPEKTSRR